MGFVSNIEDGHSGFLVNTPDEGASRVIRLIREDGIRPRMGAVAKEVGRKQYLIPRLLRDYLQLIEEVVLGRASGERDSGLVNGFKTKAYYRLSLPT